MTTSRLLIVDATKRPWWALWRPEPWWMLAAFVVDATCDVVYAKTPWDVYAAVMRFRPDVVSIAGHGAPGRPYIGMRALDPSHPSWEHCGAVWFRSCDVARGKRGHAFVARLARSCDVVAHVSRIGVPAHSYLVGVRQGGTAWWPVKLSPGSSAPWKPRTVATTDVDLPSWAFTKGGL